MRKSTFLALAAIAAIVIPHMAYGGEVNGGNNGGTAAAPMAAAPLDRSALIAEILSTWRAEIPARGMDVEAWESDMRQALATRNDGQLLSLGKASNYDSLITQLGGLAAPGLTSVSKVGSRFPSASSSSRLPLVVGDFSADLTYVPITPCRVFDTRFGSGAGKILAGGTVAFYTNSPSAGSTAFLAQGGDASLCPQIPFDPRAVMLTITAVNEEATGYLTVWPYLNPYPNTSHLNWVTNQAIANTTSVLTCYACGPDINVAVSAKTNVLGDIVGYFEPAVLPPAGRAYATVDTGASFILNKGFSAVTRPSTGVYCLATAVDFSTTPVQATVEWGNSSGNDLSVFARQPSFSCAAGNVEIRTYTMSTQVLTNNVAFNVFVP